MKEAGFEKKEDIAKIKEVWNNIKNDLRIANVARHTLWNEELAKIERTGNGESLP